ncbi:unnamed protein product, partial [marine sediment metagenome]
GIRIHSGDDQVSPLYACLDHVLVIGFAVVTRSEETAREEFPVSRVYL